MQKLDSISFGAVKYTRAGKQFLNNQSQETQKIIAKAAKKMRNYKKSNLLISKNGAAIQLKEQGGVQAYHINEVTYTIYNDVIYRLQNSKGAKKMVFNIPSDIKMQKNQLYSSIDCNEKNSLLRSTVLLAELIEKNNFTPLKTSFFSKFKDTLKENAMSLKAILF